MTDSSLAELAKRRVVLLCIHGMYGGGWYFADWLEHFRNVDLGGVALDLRGHHDSPLMPNEMLGDVSLRDYADDVLAVIALLVHAGVPQKRIVLVGHSMGGLIAQMVAAEHVVGPLVLVASAVPKPQPHYGRLFDSLRTLRFKEKMLPTGRGKILLPANPSVVRRLFAGIPEPLMSQTIARLVPESSRARHEIARGIAIRRHTQYPPTLIIAGRRDPIVPQAVLYALHLHTPRSSFYACRSGHFPMLEPIATRVAEKIVRYVS
ncbi:MAG: alpha/beta fold hydrolase [bacterium]|nr:alpha/beta fold hydrolase [bacterium]